MYLSWRVMLGKKSYTVVCHENILPPEIWGEKKDFHKPNHDNPLKS